MQCKQQRSLDHLVRDAKTPGNLLPPRNVHFGCRAFSPFAFCRIHHFHSNSDAPRFVAMCARSIAVRARISVVAFGNS